MKTKFYQLLFMFCLYAVGYGQTGTTIGLFPGHDGGFESQTVGNIGAGASGNTALSATAWTTNTISTNSRAIVSSSAARSGERFAQFGPSTVANNRMYYTPAAGNFVSGNTYQIQFWYKSPAIPAFDTNGNNVSIHYNNTSLIVPALTPASANTVSTSNGITAQTNWTKQTLTLAIPSGQTMSNGIASINFDLASSGTYIVDIDDFVIYEGTSADTSAPNSPGAITAAGALNGQANISWGAASGGVDGGGYIVVRYTASAPSASDDPLQNGIYKFNNAIGNGVVRYIGTATSFTDTSLSPGVDYYYKVYTVDKAFNYSNETVTSSPIQALATTYYYKGTGLLTDVANWGTNTDGTGTAPINFTDPSQVFEIRNTTAVSLDSTWTVGTDPVNGTKVRLGDDTVGSITLTMNNTAAIGPSGTGNFDVINPSSGNQTVIYKSGSIQLSLGNILDSNFTVIYDGATSTSASTKDFGTVSLINGSNVTFTATPSIKNLNVDATSTLVAPTNSSSFITIPSGGSVIVNGTIVIPRLSGFVSSNLGTANGTSTGTNIQFLGTENFTLGANSTVDYSRVATGTQTVSARTDYKNLRFSGTAPKSVNSLTVAGTLTVNQTVPATAVTLAGDVTVNGTLSFVSGKITTGTNTLTIGTSGSISGAGLFTGYVVGNLKKTTPSGTNPSFTYAIGDVNDYTPLTVTFTGNTSVSGGLTARTNLGDQVQIATSGLDSTKSVNRNWILTNDGLAGFGTYDANFSYTVGDNDSGATPANYLVKLYDGSTWSSITTSGTPTTTTTIATGISSFGDFAIGECTPTTSSVFESACGTSYTWPLSGQTYNASGSYNYIVGCNTTTLNLTLTPATNNTTAVSSFLTYTWANNGQTYTTSGIKTGTTTNCVTELLDLTITTTQIPTTFPAFCKGATVATATGTTSMKFYSTLTGGLPLAGTTALATGKTLFVTEVVNSVESSPRVPRLITVNVIPATPASMATTDAVLCKYVGTTNTVTYTVAPVATATSYLWSVPAGMNVIADASATDNVITVNFLGSPLNNISVGGLGTISARAVNSFDCPSAPRSLVLTAKLPTAPTSLTMTSADTTDHFNLPVVPATLPATFTFSSLADLLKITKVGPYMGTSTVFTLTAPAAPTAASYAWTLPSGATQLSGGTSNIITVDFAGVPAGIGSLPIVVKSAGGCGLSTARTLTLGRTVPGAPTALTLTNSSQSNLSSLLKITKVGPYTGTNIQFTLTATPFLTQGATSTSYAWILPSGVTCETANTPTFVNVTVPPTVEGGLPTIVSVPAISTPTNVITVNFNGATGTGNLELKVFGVNGAGNSIARKLVLARALPTAPTALVLRDGATVVTKVGPYVGESTSLTLTATPFLTQGAEATSFTWTLPAGVNVTSGATEVSNNGTTKTWTSTGTVLTIDFDGVAPAVFSLPLSVQAVNGAGTSSATRTLTVTSAAPTTPGSITTPTLAIPTYNPACPGTTTITVQVPSVFGVTYTWTVGGTEAVITGGQGTNSITIDVEAVTTTTLAISVVGSNGTGISPTRALTIKKVGTCRIAPESTTASKFSAKAYPNPSSSEFTIETSAKGAMSVKVYDMQGRLVEKADTNRVGSRLAAGAYNVIVNQGANNKTLRVIKN